MGSKVHALTSCKFSKYVRRVKHRAKAKPPHSCAGSPNLSLAKLPSALPAGSRICWRSLQPDDSAKDMASSISPGWTEGTTPCYAQKPSKQTWRSKCSFPVGYKPYPIKPIRDAGTGLAQGCQHSLHITFICD